jgi:cytochrome c-type biogenesis protein CcmI
MGASSIWHWLIVLALLGGVMVVAIGAIWAIARRLGKPATSSAAMGTATARPARARLAELAELKAQGLISDAEYAEKRREIVKSL